MGILRLSHVDVRVPDLDLATAYYTEVLGLLEVERSATEVYLKCWDEPDHHSVKLAYAPRVGLDLISFKVEADEDLAELESGSSATASRYAASRAASRSARASRSASRPPPGS